MGLPRGLTKVVQRHWDHIDTVITDALSQVEDIGLPALHGILPTEEDVYGCGSWGCAWPTNYDRWTLKITADPTEGPINQLVLEDKNLRESPGIAYILGVWELSERVWKGKYPVYVILRENIQPLGYNYWDNSRSQQKAEDMLWKAKLLGEKLNATTGRRERLYHEWDGLMLELENTHEAYMIGTFMTQFYDTFGGALADIHRNNVGKRNHYLNDLGLYDHEPSDEAWVAFDLGHSAGIKPPSVPLLPTANPMRLR